MSDAAGQRQQRTSVEVHGFLFSTTASQQFGFANHVLNGEPSGPPTEQGPRDQVVASADDELLGVVEEDAEGIHETVGVPSTAHGAGAFCGKRLG